MQKNIILSLALCFGGAVSGFCSNPICIPGVDPDSDAFALSVPKRTESWSGSVPMKAIPVHRSNSSGGVEESETYETYVGSYDSFKNRQEKKKNFERMKNFMTQRHNRTERNQIPPE